ncbi:MAG: transcription termination/antitermination protein NusG [Bacillales bacterium]|nr:transcription termination/antitermination protein NusG [Bacillales bacterium]
MEYKIEKQWYVVNTYSGHENKVKDNLERRVETQNLQDYIFRILVAEHEVPVIRDGVPTGKTKMKNLYPGYIFVEMIMTDEAWYIVRNTPGVTGFVGSSGGHAKPFPVTREQIEPVLKRMGMVDEDMYSNYSVGDLVRILSGSFEGVDGTIESIDSSLGQATVSIIFFGRPQSIDVKFSEIEKI